MRCPCSLQFAINHIPIFTTSLFVVTVIISYTWAVYLNHVPPLFPFISDTGTRAPESCFFGEMLNIGAILIIITVYLRYLELRDFVHVETFPRLNKMALISGVVAAFGVSLVANFQEGNQIELHIAGAFLVFGVGAVYMWIETYVSYKIHHAPASRLVCHLRLLFATVGLIAFANMIVMISIAEHYYYPKDGRTPINWLPEDGGWEFHTASAVSEWIVALMEMLFFATYTKEFRRFKLDFPRLKFVEIQDDPDRVGVLSPENYEDQPSFASNSHFS